jgi:hypothetical protein
VLRIQLITYYGGIGQQLKAPAQNYFLRLGP